MTSPGLLFYATYRTFLSGGTRIRTGDTMIFSQCRYVPPYVATSA